MYMEIILHLFLQNHRYITTVSLCCSFTLVSVESPTTRWLFGEHPGSGLKYLFWSRDFWTEMIQLAVKTGRFQSPQKQLEMSIALVKNTRFWRVSFKWFSDVTSAAVTQLFQLFRRICSPGKLQKCFLWTTKRHPAFHQHFWMNWSFKVAQMARIVFSCSG